MNSIAKYLIYGLVSSAGLYFMKGSKSFFSFEFTIGLFFYGLGFVIWLFILWRNDLSTAFPIASSTLIIATQVIGIWLLNENISLSKVVGVLFIMIGVFIVYRG